MLFRAYAFKNFDRTYVTGTGILTIQSISHARTTAVVEDNKVNGENIVSIRGSVNVNRWM